MTKPETKMNCMKLKNVILINKKRKIITQLNLIPSL